MSSKKSKSRENWRDEAFDLEQNILQLPKEKRMASIKHYARGFKGSKKELAQTMIRLMNRAHEVSSQEKTVEVHRIKSIGSVLLVCCIISILLIFLGGYMMLHAETADTEVEIGDFKIKTSNVGLVAIVAGLVIFGPVISKGLDHLKSK